MMKSFFLFLILLSAGIASAQNYDKYYSKLDKAFLQGDIKEVAEQYYILQDRFSRKGGTFRDSSQVQYYESKFFRLKGDYNYSEELGGRFVARIKNRLGERSPEFLEILVDKIEISVQSADYHSAAYYLNEFFDKSKTVALPDSELVYRARFYQAQNELERGNLEIANQFIDNLINKSENRLLEKKELVDKSGIKRYVEFKSEEMTNRRRDLIRAKLFKSRYFLLKGDREMIKFQASQAALHLLREELIQLNKNGD